MSRDGDNPHSLSVKLNQKTTQPQIYRFLEGITKEPRRSTLQPVADHYGVLVEAFYDPKIAAAAAVAAGMTSVNSDAVMPADEALPPAQMMGRSAAGHILKSLAAIVIDIDPASRDELAPMLSALVMGPDSQEIIDKITDYIDHAPLKKRGAPEFGARQPQQQQQRRAA